MAVLSWGKPKVEIAPSVGGSPSGKWLEVPEIKEGTAKLNTTEGTKIEAIQEGGEVVDSRTAKNKYVFEFELFVKKGDKKIIEDEDGLIVDDYALKLTPEDPQTSGFAIDCASVSVTMTWSSADGTMLKYSFAAKKPKEGKIVKDLSAQQPAPPQPKPQP